MSDAPDPPRKFYGLKPREFEVVNPPVAQSGSTSPGQPPTDVREMFRLATAPGKILGGPEKPPAPQNEVHAILRDNLAKANAAGLNELAPQTRRRGRRTRDFFVVLVAGNLFIAVVYAAELFLGFQVQCLAARMPEEFWGLVRYVLHQPAAFAMAGVGMFFFSGCLAWLMFGIMEDY